MGEIGNALANAVGTSTGTKWDRFNREAHFFFEGLENRGLITKVEVRNFVPGKMNCFFIFQTKSLENDYVLHREISRDFHEFWKSYGITDDDMVYDEGMGIEFVTEESFHAEERRVRSWVNIV